MKLTQSTLQKSFTIKHKGKTYYIDYLNSNGQILGLSNRDYWEVYNEELEELGIYEFKGMGKKKKVGKNVKLMNKLINFCIKHFEDYQPDPNDC